MKTNFENYPVHTTKNKCRCGVCVKRWIWRENLENELRKKYAAVKKMGLHERDLFLNRIIVCLLGDLDDIPELIIFIEKEWERILNEN